VSKGIGTHKTPRASSPTAPSRHPLTTSSRPTDPAPQQISNISNLTEQLTASVLQSVTQSIASKILNVSNNDVAALLQQAGLTASTAGPTRSAGRTPGPVAQALQGISDPDLRRKMRNREHAKRSRDRQRTYVQDLEKRVKELEATNEELETKCSNLQTQIGQVVRLAAAGWRGDDKDARKRSGENGVRNPPNL